MPSCFVNSVSENSQKMQFPRGQGCFVWPTVQNTNIFSLHPIKTEKSRTLKPAETREYQLLLDNGLEQINIH